MDNEHLSQYNCELEAWITSAVRSGAKDFWQLVSALPGVYPTVVREAVDRLVNEGRIPSEVAAEQPRPVADHGLDKEVPGLPTPHPLSSEWRFTRRTSADLLSRVTDTAGREGAVALLGTPSVYFLAAARTEKGEVVLLDDKRSLADRTPVPTNGNVFRCCDVRRERTDLPPVDTVLADPPWYKEDVLGFLGTAAGICSRGGTVFLGFASEGTRPGIATERDLIVEKAHGMGLTLVGMEPLALSYATPFFEHNALRASHFRYIPATWRRGDLLEFQKVGDGHTVELNQCSEPCPWTEVQVGGVEIRVRNEDPEGFADPRLIPLVNGDVLPSVSRRDPLGKIADVWTAGNRVYRCEGKTTLLLILKALDQEAMPFQAVADGLGRILSGVESEVAEGTVTQIREIVAIEQAEIGKFYNEYA